MPTAIDVQNRSIETDRPSLVEWTLLHLRATPMTYLYLAVAIVGEVTATSVLSKHRRSILQYMRQSASRGGHKGRCQRRRLTLAFQSSYARSLVVLHSSMASRVGSPTEKLSKTSWSCATQGLSQKDVALKLGCTQSRISKLESMTDADLRIGDLSKYAEVLGLELRITFESTNRSTTTRLAERDNAHDHSRGKTVST